MRKRETCAYKKSTGLNFGVGDKNNPSIAAYGLRNPIFLEEGVSFQVCHEGNHLRSGNYFKKYSIILSYEKQRSLC